MPMLILNSADIKQALPMAELVEAMKSAYTALSSGDAVVPLRSRLGIADRGATALFMPAYVPAGSGDALVVKLVTLFPENPPRGLPFIHAAVVVMDPATGEMLAMLEGGTLTARRTGAGAGAATDLLARPESTRLAVFGAGVQARTQLEAVFAVSPIDNVRVYSPTRERVRAFISEMAAAFPAAYAAASSPAEALADADIVCTATTATRPVFEDTDLPAGVHINAVGSFTPEMVELPPETLARALVMVDSRSACLEEAGELIAAQAAGLLTIEHLAEIGELAAGQAAGRAAGSQLTVFKSVGVAVQDAAAAQLALHIASRDAIGHRVEW